MTYSAPTLLLLASITSAAWAQTSPTTSPPTNVATQTAPAAADSSSGTIEKIDASSGKASIKHGPLKNLNMPAMTMNFEIDKAMLAKLKAGDKITFVAENANGRLIAKNVTIAK